MTPAEFYAQMREIQADSTLSADDRHARMDALMCRLLESLGYSDGIEIFEKTK